VKSFSTNTATSGANNVIVDQGIILEYYLDAEYADDCEVIITDLLTGDADGYLTTFHLHGIYAIFNTYFKSDAPSEIRDFTFSIMAGKGFHTYAFGLRDALETAEIQQTNADLDFDDSVLVHTAEALDENSVLAIDDDLDTQYQGDIEFDRVHPKNY
jgi:predicted nucleic acid-binding protein